MPWNHGIAHRLIECAMLASIGLCCVKIFLVDQLSAKAIIFTAAVLALCMVSALVAKQRLFLGLIALVMSCGGIPFRQIIRHYALFCVSYIALTLLLYAPGYLPTSTSGVRYTIGFLKIWQNDLGFTYYNYAAMWFFLTALYAAMIVPQKYRIQTDLICIVLMFGVFCITASRATFIVSVCAFLALLLQHTNPQFFAHIPKIRILSALLIVGLIGTVFTLTYLYSPDRPLMQIANTLLSTRLELSHPYMNLQSIGLFGNPVGLPNPLDFMYLHIAYRFGIVPLLIYIGLQIYAADRCILANQWLPWIVAIVIVIYSLNECSMRSCIMMMLYPAFANMDE